MGITFNEQEYTGELGKIKAMVETGDVPIDLVTVETSTVLQGCDDDVLIRLDYSKIADRSKFLPAWLWIAASASTSTATCWPMTRPC
jgi:putative spermidine/putrescine transport system substrate-binding protein